MFLEETAWGNMRVDERILLKWTLKKCHISEYTGFNWLRIGISVGMLWTMCELPLSMIFYHETGGSRFLYILVTSLPKYMTSLTAIYRRENVVHSFTVKLLCFSLWHQVVWQTFTDVSDVRVPPYSGYIYSWIYPDDLGSCNIGTLPNYTALHPRRR